MITDENINKRNKMSTISKTTSSIRTMAKCLSSAYLTLSVSKNCSSQPFIDVNISADFTVVYYVLRSLLTGTYVTDVTNVSLLSMEHSHRPGGPHPARLSCGV